MALSQQFTDAARLLSEGISSRGSARENLGGGSEAFGWAGGLVPTVADYATTSTASGMSVPVTLVADSATKAGIVAAGAPKPDAAAISSTTIQLVKHAGLGQATLEASLDANGLANAMASVINRQCLMSFEADSIAVLDAVPGTPVTGTTWVEAVANAQAKLLGLGARPSVLVIPSALYGAFITDVLATSAFSTSPESAVGDVLGSAVHVSSASSTKAFMFDSSAVLAVEHEQSPLALWDSLSQADTNTARLVIDVVAKLFVASASGVVEITPPAAARSGRK